MRRTARLPARSMYSGQIFQGTDFLPQSIKFDNYRQGWAGLSGISATVRSRHIWPLHQFPSAIPAYTGSSGRRRILPSPEIWDYAVVLDVCLLPELSGGWHHSRQCQGLKAGSMIVPGIIKRIKRAVVTMAGTESGTVILTNLCHCPQPSHMAASSISLIRC